MHIVCVHIGIHCLITVACVSTDVVYIELSGG